MTPSKSSTLFVIGIKHFTTLGKFGLIAFQFTRTYECGIGNFGEFIYTCFDFTCESFDSSGNCEGTCRDP